jgi:putative transposase
MAGVSNPRGSIRKANDFGDEVENGSCSDAYRTAMARRPRIFIPDISVHVIQRGINRGAIVRDNTDREVFIAFLRRAAQQHGLSVHGFALMDNHAHLLVTPPDAGSLPATMKELGGRYVHYFNRRHDRIGTLWSARYRGLLIHDERYWLTCLRYVEQNPVRAGMVRTPDAFAWSSFRFHALGAESDWLAPHWRYLELGSTPEERQAAYRAICGLPVTQAEMVEQRLIWRPSGVRRVSDPSPDPCLTPPPLADPGAPEQAPAAASSFLPHSRSSP